MKVRTCLQVQVGFLLRRNDTNPARFRNLRGLCFSKDTILEIFFNTSEIQDFIKKYWIAFVVFLLTVTAVAVGTYVYNFKNYSLSDNSADWGTFGDYIGGVIGTIFTVIAALFVWLTYESQKQQLALAKETAIKERFETTFFHMVSELRKILETVEGNATERLYEKFDQTNPEQRVYTIVLSRGTEFHKKNEKGNDFIKTLVNILYTVFHADVHADERYPELMSGGESNSDLIHIREHPNLLFNVFYLDSLNQIDYYFRFFYSILKFINKSEVQDKKLYADLLQAQLNKYELALIFYYGIGEIGKPKLFPLLEKYNFLENVNPNTIYQEHYKLYPQTAFRFLPGEEKNEIIANAIQNNPDKAADMEKTDYYLRKYNRDSQEAIKELMDGVKKLGGREDVGKLLQEALKRY